MSDHDSFSDSRPIFLGHAKARGFCFQGERLLYVRDLCGSGGTGKQKPRSCRTPESARSSARENERQKKEQPIWIRQNW